MNPFYILVAARAMSLCEYCHTPERFSNFTYEVEHIVPPSQGGGDHHENLALACRACNVFKSNHLTGINTDGKETGLLFNPRVDNWDGHFFIDLTTFEIIAKTERGHGTIVRLKLNSQRQINGRPVWIRLKESGVW